MKIGTIIRYNGTQCKYIGKREPLFKTESVIRLLGDPPVVYGIKRLRDGYIHWVSKSIFDKLNAKARQTIIRKAKGLEK